MLFKEPLTRSPQLEPTQFASRALTSVYALIEDIV